MAKIATRTPNFDVGVPKVGITAICSVFSFWYYLCVPLVSEKGLNMGILVHKLILGTLHLKPAYCEIPKETFTSRC